MYQVSGLVKHAMLDNFSNGCDPGVTQQSVIPVTLSAESLNDLIAKTALFIGCSPEDADLDANDEIGRVDFSKIENRDGNAPTNRQLELWKSGDIDLWTVEYTCYVEYVTPVSAKQPVCAYEFCGAPAADMAAVLDDNLRFTPKMYCEYHAELVVNLTGPEYVANCPACGCRFGIN